MYTLETPQKWMQFTSQDVKAQEAKLKQTLLKAGTSPLYKKLWKSSGFNPDKVEGLSDLCRLPFLGKKELFEATEAKVDKVCVAPVSQWFLGFDQSPVHEWFPYSEEDFNSIVPMLKRMGQTVGLKKGDLILDVVDAPPRLSAFISYLWSYAPATRDSEFEFITCSMEWYDTLEMTWINFIEKRRPTAIFSSAKNARALAEKIENMNPSFREAFSKTRIGLFYGDHMEIELLKTLKPYAALETFEVYAPTEHSAFWCECPRHTGLHVWLDTCIPEVIPAGHKDAQMLRDSTIGTKGELVITNFSEALPLIRYRTGKQITVEGTGDCSCGCNHPRIKFLEKIV